MPIDDNRVKQVIDKFESAIDSLGRMEAWLPQAINNAIDNALHGHRGTLDRVDIDRMIGEKKEDERISVEISNLFSQLEESKKQTNEIKKQTKYLFFGLLLALITFIIDLISRIK